MGWNQGGTGGSGPAPGSYLPTADTTGVTIDTTTYDNPNGSGKIATLVFPADPPEGAQPALAIALQGDAFPRQYLFANPGGGGGADYGDGTQDPWNGQSAGWVIGSNGDGTYFYDIIGNAGASFGALSSTYGATIRLSRGALQLDRADEPGVVGAALLTCQGVPVCGGTEGDLIVRTDGAGVALTTIYRCTTTGDAGDAVWDGIV